MSDPIDRLTEAIKNATIPAADVFTAGAALDATVPNRRFTVVGAGNVAAELAHWYADPGRFEELKRIPLPHGELVEFVLSWEQGGEPHMCHQAHVVEVAGGLIVRDTAFCGGGWGAALMAEMAEVALDA